MTIGNHISKNSACSMLHIPIWAINSHEHRTNDFFACFSFSSRRVYCNQSKKMSFEQLILVFGKFLHHLWKSCKEENRWKSSILYENLTPQWLRGDVLFLYGRNNTTIACSHGVLPRKSVLKEKGQKIVGSAILPNWLQHESSS